MQFMWISHPGGPAEMLRKTQFDAICVDIASWGAFWDQFWVWAQESLKMVFGGPDDD